MRIPVDHVVIPEMQAPKILIEKGFFGDGATGLRALRPDFA